MSTSLLCISVAVCINLQATWTMLTITALQSTSILLFQCANSAHSLNLAEQVVGRSLERAAVSKFTITPYYDPSVSNLTSQQQTILKSILLDSAIEWFSKSIKVRPMMSSIVFERSCTNSHYMINDLKYCSDNCSATTKCGPVIIPKEHLAPCRVCSKSGLQYKNGEGAETGWVGDGHFLLYVSALNESHCHQVYPGSSFVEARHCLQEKSFDRPIAGYINICPSVSTKPDDILFQQHAVMHELLHGLVFSESLFPYFHNEDGYPRGRRIFDGSVPSYPDGSYRVDPNILRQISRTKWTILTPAIFHSVKMIVTPNVVREVREHFNCSTLIGAELENQGGWRVARTHWESRLFGNELMTAASHAKPVLSRITLALMEDSGWYLPDYSYGGHLLWGRNRGCSFVEDSCGGWKSYTDRKKILLAPFCDRLDHQHNKSGCVNERTGFGPCLIRNYSSPLPVEYQYLSRRIGGIHVLADYCPLYAAIEYPQFRVGSSCLNPDYAPRAGTNLALKVYSPDSKCFEHTRPIKQQMDRGGKEVVSYPEAGCYQFTCQLRSIQIQIGNQTIYCNNKRRRVNFLNTEAGVTYTDSIVCPPWSEVCSEYDCLNMCSGHGTCSMGECRCDYGYFGDDCSQSFSQRLLSCENVTCLNRGTCVTLESGGFSCKCVSNFTGAFCEQDKIEDPCSKVTCNRNGFCTRTNGGKTARCNCYRGYKGRQCKMLSDLCALNGKPCLNNNSCITNTTTCLCTSDFWGVQCEILNDLCKLYSCESGKLCVHHNNSQTYTCTCPHGYLGENCTRTDFCSTLDHPCRNNGTCVNHPKKMYKCICPTGFKGRRCNKKIVACSENLCRNNGTCEAVEASVRCRCLPNYTGDFCQTSIGIE